MPIKKSRTYKRKSTVSKSVKLYVKNAISAKLEDKFIDYPLTGVSIDSAGTIYNVTGITQGTGVSQRIGNQINIKKILINMQFVRADAHNTVRVLFFKWNDDSNQNPPTLAKLLTGVGTYAPDFTPYYHLNYLNLKQKLFRPIYDKRFKMDSVEQNVMYNTKAKVSKLNQKVDFLVDGSTLGSGLIYLLLVSDSTAVANPACTVMTRVIYEDA